ncbi:MAG: bifunctional UDP-N-acetylglucosamine diphosphorylase/glucosamine-1-phosphate N-acetyltransferase GlmU [Firmicutes bacterium]|nr:bifunctional UDP-N-acetylglucosamine diphosphorylase/glucosamine-1-phosphate N-acetyltransferase GlmU [Bacillota bacterium]
MKNIGAVILAAGKGTRMKSALPKVLHTLLNKPLLQYVVEAVAAAGIEERLVVIGHEGEMVQNAMENLAMTASCSFVKQEPQLGTAHAIQIALPRLKENCTAILVLCGDTPLLSPGLLDSFIKQFFASKAAAAVLSADLPDPHGYGRIIRNNEGGLKAIVEEKDAGLTEKAICEINSGIYCFDLKLLKTVLNDIKNDNANGEYYLSDAIAALGVQGHKVLVIDSAPAEEILGINDRLQLAAAAKILQNRINSAWMKAGVTITDPLATYIDADVSIGVDTIIEPQSFLRAGTSIGCGCKIGPATEISASSLGDGVYARHAIIIESEIGHNCDIGPFTYIRPGSKLAASVKAGHCVELKKAEIGEGSKVPHLSYVGDAVLGHGVNIGCGAITCNYDGQYKHITVIGDDAFIGSNTNFVAPVNIGARAITGAGSTITKDVPEDALAIERAEQKNIEGWALRKESKKQNDR